MSSSILDILLTLYLDRDVLAVKQLTFFFFLVVELKKYIHDHFANGRPVGEGIVNLPVTSISHVCDVTMSGARICFPAPQSCQRYTTAELWALNKPYVCSLDVFG